MHYGSWKDDLPEADKEIRKRCASEMLDFFQMKEANCLAR